MVNPSWPCPAASISRSTSPTVCCNAILPCRL